MLTAKDWLMIYQEGSEVTDALKPDTVLTVYHGTNGNGLKDMLVAGIDATKVHSRSYNQGRERGLYITDDIKTARKFGNWIVEFECKGKDLFPTATFGASRGIRNHKGMIKHVEEQYPNSFRKFTSYMLRDTIEPQAMFIGYIPLKSIKAIHYFDYDESGQQLKTYTVEEVQKILNVDETYHWDINMTGEEVSIRAGEIYDLPHEEMLSFLKIPEGFSEFANNMRLPRKLRFRLKEYIRGL